MLRCLVCIVAGLYADAQRAYPFYPGRENEVRVKPFSERVAFMPTGWETPAWKALTYVAPDPRITLVYDRQWIQETEKVKESLFRRLETSVKDMRPDNLTRDMDSWKAAFNDIRNNLSRRLEAVGLHQNSSSQILLNKFSLAVPGASDRLWRTAALFEGLRCLTHLPLDMTMSITEPSSYWDYVSFRSFLSLVPDFVSELPKDFSVKIVTHSDSLYRQWGNRWMAANFTNPQTEWITFFDNDDFPAPRRWLWLDQIFTKHPEIDVFLAGKYRHTFETLNETLDYVVGNSLNTSPPASNDTAIIAEVMDFQPERGYLEPMSSMNSTMLGRWRVGSVIGSPLYVGKYFFINQLYRATYEALNHTDQYDASQLQRIQEELEYLTEIDAHVDGGDWGDFWVSDGWSTIRRQLLSLIHPPTVAVWGEDSLYNWMIAASGFNYFHMVPPFYHMKSGVYIHWRPGFWPFTDRK
eukprot:Gregarina_sp_Poly_1__900@NODE_1215_length_4764_cov_206_758569_g829_i0_p2_GENE_NODE_1215_length_4764_cov_206_758569_g829_i0NODE_1215_length_4764_cov_206_758569_g829_i0_p2_ORF_typecomplete_len466_score55_53Glycos_transf_2/PF00535_26/0_053Myb_DNAbind_5/PF13873_6/0_12_NODE_1215_length_4764_cov_206_758569_g829_i011142511